MNKARVTTDNNLQVTPSHNLACHLQRAILYLGGSIIHEYDCLLTVFPGMVLTEGGGKVMLRKLMVNYCIVPYQIRIVQNALHFTPWYKS